MNINQEKTITGKNENQQTILLENKKLQVRKFKYLGLTITQNRKLDDEIIYRTVAACILLNSIRNTFLREKEIPKETQWKYL